MNSKKRKVIISLFMGSCAGRRHLAGVFRYISRGSDWDVQLCRFGELTAKMVLDADGIITSPHIEKDVLRLVGKRGIPLVTIDIPEQKVRDNGLLSRIFSDDRSVGAAMARHVLSYGNFRSYHFIYDGHSHWAVKRLEGAADALKTRNRTLSTFVRPKDDEPVPNPPDLTGWLKGIAKPAVVMAATDALAIEVLNAARAARMDLDELVVAAVQHGTGANAATQRLPVRRQLSIDVVRCIADVRARLARREAVVAPGSGVLACEVARGEPLCRAKHRTTAVLRVILRANDLEDRLDAAHQFDLLIAQRFMQEFPLGVFKDQEV